MENLLSQQRHEVNKQVMRTLYTHNPNEVDDGRSAQGLDRFVFNSSKRSQRRSSFLPSLAGGAANQIEIAMRMEDSHTLELFAPRMIH